MYGFRRDFTFLLILFLILITFAVSSSPVWINWAVFVFIAIFWLIVDFLFFDTDDFLFEPSTHDAWALRSEQIKNA